MQQARILDKNRQLKAILPGVRWHYARRINEATAIEISIPRETIDEHITQSHALYGFFAPSQPLAVQGKPARAKPNKAQYAEIASYVQIYKGDVLKASGKIVGRTLGQVVTVEAYTEEILLEANLTPAQYGKVWDGWGLADVARDLLDGWRSLRVKAQSQWQDRMVASSNIDLTTDPGLVMLAKRASGQYYDSGYITLVFNKSEISNFKSWDRVRWSADSEDPVATSIQVSTNGVSFSNPFDGGLPEEIGYYIGGDHDQVWVRINLSTTDTESEDANEVPTGVTPTVFAIEVIARTEGDLVAGNIPTVAGVTVKGLSADHASAFRVLVDACDQVDWEFNVWDGALNITEALGTDRTRDFVFRAGTNIEIQTLGDGDGELANILTAYGPGRGINRMEITLRDEASIAEFGEYPLAMEFDVEKLSELEQKAQEFLDEHNLPKTQFEVAVAFDHDKEPDYGLGDKVRVADPETGIVTTARIMSEAREYGEEGLSVHLGLGKANFTLSEAIGGEKRATKPLDPLQPTGVYARGVIAGVVVGCAVPKIDWAYTECHLSTASGFTPSSSTHRTSGRQNRFDIMELTPGVRYYAKVVHVDNAGRRSEASQEVSAVANYMSPELLPDYSLGVEKFMENLKPPIVVTSLPNLPDPRYTIGTSVFLTTDKKLYSTDGNTWEPVGAGTVTADEVMAGIITAGGITADYYAELRNTWVEPFVEDFDAGHPIEYEFEIPSETTSIVSIRFSAYAQRFRANSKGAAAGGGQTTSSHTGSHTHNVNIGTQTSDAVTSWVGSPYDIDTQSALSGATVRTDTHISPTAGSHNHGGGASHSHDFSQSGYPTKVTSTEDGHYHEFPPGYTSYKTDSAVTGIGYDGSHHHGSHSHDVPLSSLAHSHKVNIQHKHDLNIGAITSSEGGDIHSHDVSDHQHSLVFGMFESTTPNGVMLFCDDGNGYGEGIALSVAPDSNTPYALATELDITSMFSGTGWKKIKLTTSRLGRINFKLMFKYDLTA